MSEEIKYAKGIGLDVGTSFLQVARETLEGQVEFVAERDAFYAIRPSSPIAAKFVEKSLRQRGAFILKSEGVFYIVGKQGIEIAIERGGQVERPLKRGVLSMRDKDAMGMLAVLIEALVKKASTENEICVHSFPSDPVDGDFDVIYHQNRIAEILGNLGYKSIPLLEAEALVYSELADYDWTGMTISCGAGMFNIVLAHMGETVVDLSIAQGGDYIDSCVAKPLGISETEVQAEKENDLDLDNPKGRIQETIVMYYDNLVKYLCNILEKKFEQTEKVPKFGGPLPIVLAGGTSIPRGFVERVSDGLKSRKFPFEVGEVRGSANPLTSVANGCLIYSRMLSDE